LNTSCALFWCGFDAVMVQFWCVLVRFGAFWCVLVRFWCSFGACLVRFGGVFF
jgi:hypothetical protein